MSCLHSPVRCLTILFALVLVGPAWAEASFSGHLTVEDEQHAVADALAYREGMFLRVVFSDQRYDLAAMTADGRLTAMDFLRHDGVTLELRLYPDDGGYAGLSLNTATGSSGGMSSRQSEALTIERIDQERVVGHYDDGAHQLQFDLPIQAEQVQRSGTELPVDGGAPGAALRAMIQAVHDGDVEALLASQPPEQAEQMQQALAGDEAEQMLTMAKQFTPVPDGFQIHGGRQDDATAWIDFTGRDAFGVSKGTATMREYEGRWRVESMATTMGADD